MHVNPLFLMAFVAALPLAVVTLWVMRRVRPWRTYHAAVDVGRPASGAVGRPTEAASPHDGDEWPPADRVDDEPTGLRGWMLRQFYPFLKRP